MLCVTLEKNSVYRCIYSYNKQKFIVNVMQVPNYCTYFFDSVKLECTYSENDNFQVNL